MRPSAAAVTASSPSKAPVGTMICPPRAFASSMRSGRGNNAPAESTIDLLSRLQHGPANALERRGWSTFDGEIGVVRKLLRLDQRTGNPLGVQPGLRLAPVAHGRTGERKTRHAVGQVARNHATDGAEPGNGDAMNLHGAASGIP